MIGEPANCIALAAREHAADLVMGPRTPMRSPRRYSATLEAALSQLECPLLTILPGSHRSWSTSDEEVPVKVLADRTAGIQIRS
jgi:hypothetical protein